MNDWWDKVMRSSALQLLEEIGEPIEQKGPVHLITGVTTSDVVTYATLRYHIWKVRQYKELG